MKTLLLAAVISGYTLHLKAQQFRFNLSDTVKKHSFSPDLKLNNPAKFFNPMFNYNYNFGLTQRSVMNVFYSRMPVLVISGEYKMPVVRLDGKSFMPVKRINEEQLPVKPESIRPGMPTFVAPGG